MAIGTFTVRDGCKIPTTRGRSRAARRMGRRMLSPGFPIARPPGIVGATRMSQPSRIHDMAVADRPRERLAERGPKSLNTAELIAILLRTGLQGASAVEIGHHLLRAGDDLSSILGSWKSFTSKEANKVLGRTGRLWQEDYFDRFIRDENQNLNQSSSIRDHLRIRGIFTKLERHCGRLCCDD